MPQSRRVFLESVAALGASRAVSAHEPLPASDPNRYELSNGKIAMVLDAAGHLIKLTNRQTGNDYVSGGNHAPWRMYYRSGTPMTGALDLTIEPDAQKAQIQQQTNSVVIHYAVTMLYDLPVGRGKSIGANLNRVVDAFVGGWQVSALMNYQSGIPIPMSAPGNGFGFAYNPPNITSGSAVSIGNPSVYEWFNVNAFSQPAPFTIGSAPRRITQLREDGTHNADVSLNKNFKIWESINLQFRTDFFNLSNTPQFGAPNTAVGSSTFGQVTYQANSPRAIQFGLKLTF